MASSNPQFIHLRLHSEFSITDGIVRIPEVIECAKADQQGALALTDLNNFFGLIKFYKKAIASGIKPLLGCDVWVSEQPGKAFRLLFLIQNQAGYLNLCELLTRAYLTNQYKGRAEINLNWLDESTTEGLIALSGALQGNIGLACATGQYDQAKANAQYWKQLFPQRFYLEVQRCGQTGEAFYNQQILRLATECDLPVVATHPIQFMHDEEFIAHEARVCISQGELLANPNRVKSFTTAQSFKTQAEMAALFADIPSALINSVEIAKRCNVCLELGVSKLPLFPTPEGLTLDDYFKQLSSEGLEQRLVQRFPDEQARVQQRESYQARLVFECETIIKMGFSGYFLIVADFINWAKQNDVPVGPGRGSGAGSLVAYALGITELDPIQYNLLFERFLNPERISMPDFDIDFCQEGRDRVIAYVKDKYGAQAVSQIATFGSMAAKAAVRDMGRVLDLGYNFTDSVAKLIPFKPGKQITIADAMKEEAQLSARYEQEDEVKQLLDLAQQVEGITRNVGMHAGGVLIAPGKLTDFCPLFTQNDEAGVVSQYDKDDVEAIGLVKFDFLGLTTLTIIHLAQRYIRDLYADKATWRIEQIEMNDQQAMHVFKQANTVAVFQFESRGMQGLLRDASPERFEEIIALIALFRPGPMELIPSFCARKHGREHVEYLDPRLEPILKETFGIMVYQEQVMQTAQIIGGYSLGSADLLRRAMGKKKADEMAEQRSLFREGAQKNGLQAQHADEIFDLMEKFAGYGFNKSHAAAYALLAYYTAWLKAHFPAEFMAANLSLALDDTDKIKVLYEDCLQNGIEILPPDINQSMYRFVPIREHALAKQIYYGLGALKGTGQSAIEEIIRARQQGPFVDLFDFCQRVDRRIVSRRTVESLIRGGAFDRLHADRGRVFASLNLAFDVAEQASANALQVSLFEQEEAGFHYALLDVPAWPIKQQLQEEKNALGFYFSGHMFDAYRAELKSFVKTSLANLTEGRDRLVAGIITSLRMQMTQRGKMLILSLDDGTAQCEVTVFNELYKKYRPYLVEDELLVIRGQARYDHYSGGLRLVAEQMMDLSAARSQYAKNILLVTHKALDISQLKAALQPFLGQAELTHFQESAHDEGLLLHILYQSQLAESQICLGEHWRLKPSEAFVAHLKSQFQDCEIEICYG